MGTRSETSLLRILQERYKSLSRGQKQIADLLLAHYDRAAFFTAAQLAEAAGVSESTAVRFASELGYSGYQQMKEELAKLVRSRIDVTERMERTYSRTERSKILDEVLETDMLLLSQTREMISAQAFDTAVTMLENAKDIYIIGLRSGAPLAQYLYFQLRLMFHHVYLVSSSSEHELLEQLIHADERDVVVGISFPRYSLRTLRMLEFVSGRRSGIITLTDSIHSPINLYASCVLTAAAQLSSVSGSLAAAMGVADALITSLSLKNSAALTTDMKLLERILREYETDGNDEMDWVEEGEQVRLKAFAEEEE